jgi:hypothetical protein
MFMYYSCYIRHRFVFFVQDAMELFRAKIIYTGTILGHLLFQKSSDFFLIFKITTNFRVYEVHSIYVPKFVSFRGQVCV